MSKEAMKLALEALENAQANVGEWWPEAITVLREALASEAIEQPAQQQEPLKLWLWKNFVKGRPEYWAFDNAFPVNMNNDDPQVMGEPCGYAWLKPSRQGRFDVSDEEVLRAVQNAKEYPPASKPLTDEEIKRLKPISADFVSFRAGVRCMEREYRIGEKR